MDLRQAVRNYHQVVARIENDPPEYDGVEAVGEAFLAVARACPDSPNDAIEQIDIAIDALGLDAAAADSMCESPLYLILRSAQKQLKSGTLSHKK